MRLVPDERRVRTAASALSFWAAVLLPLLYLPVLSVAIGRQGGVDFVLGLLGLHVLALIGGRSYNRDSVDDGRVR